MKRKFYFKKSFLSTLFALIIFLVINIYQKTIPQKELISISPTPTIIQRTDGKIYKVARVIDGDTIEIETLPTGTQTVQTVRYIGIDTPELHHPKKPVQCFGYEAMVKNKELVEGKMVRLEKDVSETDKYKRLLRYVYLTDETSTKSATFINEVLVREGYAHAATFPPDVKYQNLFLEAEKDARLNKRGLWSGCN